MHYVKSASKQILSNNDELVKVVSTALGDMATICGCSLGPGGRPVIIERDNMAPLITKDGVTIAKALGEADASANIIVDAAKEICINTGKQAGDGTTTAIVLANALVNNGHKFLANNPKYNPQLIVRELKEAYDQIIVPHLKNISIPATTEQQLKNVAFISSNGDKEIADAAVQAVMDAGDDGTVLLHEHQGTGIKVETVEGYVVTTGLKDLGQIGPAFINDKANQQVVMDHGVVVLYDGTLNDLKVPGYIQNAITDTGFSDATPIIVFAHGFADVVLDKFAKTSRGGLSIIPIKVPRSGLPNGGSMFLEDMAAYTGGRIFDPVSVEDMEREDFGKFENAKVNMYESFILADSITGAIDTRIQELKSIEKAAFSELDKSFIRAAIAKLTSGVASILVGGNSDVEIRERKDRAEDAVEAVRSAIAEGIVTGGCSVHILLAHVLSTHPNKKASWDILIESLHSPFKLLLKNCGEDIPNVTKLIDDKFNGPELPTYVFDATNHELVDPIKAGIIEPSKVVRVSIGNALSVASLLTTLGGIVVRPRDSQLETQLELANQSFKNMMSAAGE